MSALTGDRGTNFGDGTGGLSMDFFPFRMIGVDGILRMVCWGGDLLSWSVGNEPRRSYVVPPRNDSGPVERRKSDNSRVEFSLAC